MSKLSTAGESYQCCRQMIKALKRWKKNKKYVQVLDNSFCNDSACPGLWCLTCLMCSIYLSKVFKLLRMSKTLPKAQRIRGLSSSCQSKFLRSYHKFKHKSASTKNLNQTSAPPQNLKFKILTKPSFRISTKIQLHNLYKTSAAKC